MDELTRVCQFILRYRAEHPDAQKDEIAAATAQRFGLKSARKVYVGRDFAIRFSHASGASFSNVVLSLSALRPFDDRPFVVCVVRPSSVEFLLANATFLKKISHSSHQLRVDNVRGSFLGHDIVRRYGSLENQPENFSALFAAHRERTWEENLKRLVSATDEIVGTVARMVIDPGGGHRIVLRGRARTMLTALRHLVWTRAPIAFRAQISTQERADLATVRSPSVAYQFGLCPAASSIAAVPHSIPSRHEPAHSPQVRVHQTRCTSGSTCQRAPAEADLPPQPRRLHGGCQ